MIVKGDKNDQPVTPNQFTDTESNPPPYSPPSQPSTSSNIHPPLPSGPTVHPPSATRCNYLNITRENSSIKGAYIVDPNLHIPAELLAPLEEGEHEQDRPNLKLKCKNASVTADVWVEDVVDGDEESVRDVKGKVVIDVSSYNGSASVNLTANLLLRPVQIKVTSQNGSASLVIPSTFTGPLSIGSRNGSISISEMIQGRSTSFAEVKGIGSYFVGDFKRAGFGSGEWHGSSAHVESYNGRVKICFAEEAAQREACKRGSSSFFSRLFGGV